MVRSRCVNLNLIHPEFYINCQWRVETTYIQSSFAIQSKQHYIVGYTNTMFTLYGRLGSKQTFKLAALNLKLAALKVLS